MGCCVAFLVTTSLNGVVVLVAGIAENPRLPKPVRLDSTTHMLVHRAATSITFYIHAYYLHYFIYTHFYILSIIGTLFLVWTRPLWS